MQKSKSPMVKTTFEQVPVELAKKIARQETALPTADLAYCAVCGDSVNLESCKTNEHGKAVHQNCYMVGVLGLAEGKFSALGPKVGK